MFPFNGVQSQKPVVYVFVAGQNGEPGTHYALPASMTEQTSRYPPYASSTNGSSSRRSPPDETTPRVEILQSSSSSQRSPSLHSHAAPRYLDASSSSSPSRHRAAASRREESSSLRGNGSAYHLHPPPRGAPHHASLRDSNVEILTIPTSSTASYGSPSASMRHHFSQLATFPPPGATIQTIQPVSSVPSQAYGHPSSSTTASRYLAASSQYASSASSSLAHHPSLLAVQQQQQLASLTAANAGLSNRFDPSIKFVHAPPGATIPPQPFATYQLVPAGYHVVPAHSALGRAADAMAPRDQEKDQHGDEEKLLREPIVLSGNPYSYPVNIGKDVVSGKGGRAQQYNKHFRKLITDAYPRYNETGSKIEKREIGIRIYLTIVKAGGRFLDAAGNPMNRSKAILKVMKALKDAKTWANDEKRMAAKARKKAKERAARGELDPDSIHDDDSQEKTDEAMAVADDDEDDDGIHDDMDEDEVTSDEDDHLDHEVQDDAASKEEEKPSKASAALDPETSVQEVEKQETDKVDSPNPSIPEPPAPAVVKPETDKIEDSKDIKQKEEETEKAKDPINHESKDIEDKEEVEEETEESNLPTNSSSTVAEEDTTVKDEAFPEAPETTPTTTTKDAGGATEAVPDAAQMMEVSALL